MIVIKAIVFNAEVGLEGSIGPLTVEVTPPTVQQVIDIVDKESPKENNCLF